MRNKSDTHETDLSWQYRFKGLCLLAGRCAAKGRGKRQKGRKRLEICSFTEHTQ